MNIVYYTYPQFFDSAFCYLDKLSNYEKIDLFIELSPYIWHSSLFDLPSLDLPGGIIEGTKYLQQYFPPEINKIITKLRIFNLVVYKNKKSIHYKTFFTSTKVLNMIDDIQPDLLHFFKNIKLLI